MFSSMEYGNFRIEVYELVNNQKENASHKSAVSRYYIRLFDTTG